MPTASSSSTDTVTAPPPSTAAHPSKPSPTSPLPRPPPSDPLTAPLPIKPQPPLFAASPLLGRPTAPNPAPPPPFTLPRPAFSPTVRPTGYIRNPSFAAAVAAASQQAQPRPPFVFADQLPRPQPAAAQRQVRPAAGTAPAAPPASGPLPTAPPKVASFPALSSTPEYNNCKERDKCKDDAVVMIHDRKVRLSDGGSGSLYALCRSWVHNGLPQENQPTIGDGVRLLPRPLPASYVEANSSIKIEDDIKAEDHGDEEHVGSGEQLSAQELLEGHIKRAKRVRAQLRKKRILRIERYKQRLALLLPPPSELGRCDAASGS